MTWAWSIPIKIEPPRLLRSSALDLDHTRAIIPTFRDWDDARETVESLLDCRPRPREIVIVDDNAEPDVPSWVRRLPVHVAEYAGNRGPSHARNVGVEYQTGHPIDWFYFTDTACTRDRSFFAALGETRMLLPSTTVAIAGPVVGEVLSAARSPINLYMTEEAILNPPIDRHGPQAIVTANAAVSAAAFRAVGGFDASYPFAAAEDLDLGLKLRHFGTIGWTPHAVVRHRFLESIEDFRRRFVRYGAGNAHLERRWHLRGMRVERIISRDPSLQRFADLQVMSMRHGYDKHREHLEARSISEVVSDPAGERRASGS
jgi:GT2 family glycosyltransferase